MRFSVFKISPDTDEFSKHKHVKTSHLVNNLLAQQAIVTRLLTSCIKLVTSCVFLRVNQKVNY
jgi:hypothetical protein